jgi:hypothetical protein
LRGATGPGSSVFMFFITRDYLAQFLTPHILGHMWFKIPGIMLKNYSDFPQSHKEMPDEINEAGHNHIFLNSCQLKIYENIPILSGNTHTANNRNI